MKYNISVCIALIVCLSLGACHNKQDEARIKAKDNYIESLTTISADKQNKIDSLKKLIDSLKYVPKEDSSTTDNIQQGGTKYVYVKIKSSKPRFERSEYTGKTMLYWTENIFSSEVLEIQDYDEDKKYKVLDGVVSNMKLSWSDDPQNSRHEVEKILDRKCLVFSSYAAASKDKYENGNTF